MEKRASNGSDSNFEFLKDIPNKSRAKKTVLTKTVFFASYSLGIAWAEFWPWGKRLIDLWFLRQCLPKKGNMEKKGKPFFLLSFFSKKKRPFMTRHTKQWIPSETIVFTFSLPYLLSIHWTLRYNFFFACSIFYWFLRTKHVEWKLHILKPFTKSVQLEETTKRVGLVAETLFV